MFSSLLPLLSTYALLVVASPSPYSLHERRQHTPSGWSHSHRHNPHSVLPLRFALSQSNIHKIDDFINKVSDPDSPDYGNHWSAARVAQTFAPTDETVNTVRNWLIDSGIAPERLRLTFGNGWIEVNATVAEAEALLLAEYNVYQHESGKVHVACDSYHLPAHITPHVDLVTPTVHFNAILNKRANGEPARKVGQPGFGTGPTTTGSISEVLTELADCNKQITPACLRALYKFVYEPLAADKNSYAIVEYTPQAYLQSDLDKFFGMFDPTLVGSSPKLESVDGGVVQTDNKGFEYNGESDLDLEYGMALVTDKQKVTLYQVGDLYEGASFNNLLDALDGTYCTFEGGDDKLQDGIYPDPKGYNHPQDCGTITPAHVISTSYGYNEADLSPAYIMRQCAEYAKLGMMGVTVLYSSGDNGVAGNGGRCLNPDGSQSTDGTIFNPTFPSTCPYVTSVGATQIAPGKTVADPETACEQVIYSGGGFSNHFAIPDYQKELVGEYLQNHKPKYPGTIWNSSGKARAYPDLSANGANYVVAVDGEFALVYGTSASAPVIGAILTMVNDARLFAGKSPIGFINPAIYSKSFRHAFNDITEGGNQGCGTAGFSAVPGWDPVTGLGTPNFVLLVAQWLLHD